MLIQFRVILIIFRLSCLLNNFKHQRLSTLGTTQRLREEELEP